MAQIELSSLVDLTQSYIAKNYATALIDKSKTAELKAYIRKYLYDTGYSVAGYDTKGLVERLFTEMAEYSIVFVAIVVYFSESKKVTKMIAAKRKKIEYELPRLVGSIEKTMKHQKGAIYALEAFKDTTCPELKEELEITIADMRSGNEEVALTRLESRVGIVALNLNPRCLILMANSGDSVFSRRTTPFIFVVFLLRVTTISMSFAMTRIW